MNSGIRHLAVDDPNGVMHFPAIVQYPTHAPSIGATIGPYTFDATLDAPLASPTADSSYPVCVISHGGGGSHLLYRSIATYLAARGFIVVCPEHPHDNRNDRSQSDTDVAAANRPRHASLAIDAVIADPFFAREADGARVCVVGHSMGGFTALAMAGGRPWSRSRQPIPVSADPRLRAAVLLAPATDWFLAPESLAKVSVPLLVLAGEHDPVTPPQPIRDALAGLPASTPVTIAIVPGAGHFSFLTPFPPHMRRPDFPPSTDPEGFDREQFHRELPVRIHEFLAASLSLAIITDSIP